MSYIDATDIAREVRVNVKKAQKGGALDRGVKVSVRVARASMCTEINVWVRGDKLTNTYLLRPEGERREHGCWTPAALELATKMHELMAKAEEWADGRMRFTCLY